MLSMPDSLEPMPEQAARIAILIVDRPMCLPCIATNVDMSIASVMGYLEHISKSVTVSRSATERCRQCGRAAHTVSIVRDGGARPGERAPT